MRVSQGSGSGWCTQMASGSRNGTLHMQSSPTAAHPAAPHTTQPSSAHPEASARKMTVTSLWCSTSLRSRRCTRGQGTGNWVD